MEKQEKRPLWRTAITNPLDVPKTPARLQVPELFSCDPDKAMEKRNALITNLCRKLNLSLHISKDTVHPDVQLTIDTPWKNVKYADISGDGQKTRMWKVACETLAKMSESKLQIDDEAFDYSTFQASLQLQANDEEMKWILKQIHTERTIEWKRPLQNKQAALFAFEKLYGPINPDSAYGKNILRNFRLYSEEAAAKSNQKLTTFRAYKQNYGLDKCVLAIQRHYEFENKRVTMHAVYSEDMLREIRGNVNTIYNPNPFTSPNHAELFLLPRFRNQPGPTSLFIRHEHLEPKLIDYQLSQEHHIINGYWPGIMDLSYSHPVRLSPDPCKRKKNKDPAIYDTTALREKMFDGIYNAIKEDILKFPTGVEINHFVDYIRTERYSVLGSESLFPGIEETKAVLQLTELVKDYYLPTRNVTIVFPAVMKNALPKDEQELLSILRRVWNKLLAVIKYNGKIVCCQDVQLLMWETFKINIEKTVTDWGFESYTDFVEWSMAQWNPDGTEDGIIVLKRQALSKEDDIVPILAFSEGLE